jgi:hypothetical protein
MKKGVWIIAGVFAFVAAASVLSFCLMRKHAQKEAISALSIRQQKGLEQYLNKPVRVPADWQKPVRYTDRTLHLLALVNAGWQLFENDLKNTAFTSRDSNFARLGDLQSDAATTASQIVYHTSGWLVNVAKLVNQPDYKLEIFFEPPPVADETRYDLARTVARLLCLQAVTFQQSGRNSEALGCALNALQLARREAASPLRTHLEATAILHGASSTLADLAATSRDSRALSSTIATMNRVDSGLNIRFDEDPTNLHMIGTLRSVIAQGYPADLSSTQTGAELVHEYLQAESNFPSWKRKTSAAADSQSAPVQNSPAFRKASFFEKLYQRAMGTRNLDDYSRVAVNEKLAHQRYCLGKASFDLARLALLQQLYLLEQRKPLEQPSQLIPAYLKTVPNDPYTGKPYLWSIAEQRFYSAGPDGKDDQLQILYRPELEQTTTGDLIIP